MGIGRRIRELREERDLSGTELARRSGLTRNSVSRIELGHHMPSAATIEKLARGLDVDPGELFESPLAGAR
jgi:transcriptional regulator with XRE-family HTH domain